MIVEKVVAHLCLTLIIWKTISNDKRRRDMVVGNVVAQLCLTLIIWQKFNNDKRRRDIVVGKVVAHLCLTLNIWKKINNDKRRRDMVVRKVVAHLCLTLIIKELKFCVEYDRVVTTLNIIKHYISYLVYSTTRAHLPKRYTTLCCIMSHIHFGTWIRALLLLI